MFCLDSTFLIDLLKGDPSATRLLVDLEHDGVATTHINIFEVFTGIYHKSSNPTRAIAQFDETLRSCSLLPCRGSQLYPGVSLRMPFRPP